VTHRPWPTWCRLIALGAVVGASGAAKCGSDSDCPLQIRRIYLSGRAPQIIVRNKASYPVGQIVLHVAYEDLFSKYQEPTQAFDTIVRPKQRVTLSFPSIQGSIEWETVNVFATCQRVDSVPQVDSVPGR